MSKPKFKVNDLVHIKKDMPVEMSHFTKDKDAIIVEYSHNKCQAGNDCEHGYVLHIKGHGHTAWYHDSNLVLIEHDRSDLLPVWIAEEKKKEKQESNLDWIFKNGKAVMESASGASIGALANCFGMENLWGSRGEGITYYVNARKTLLLAKPFLEDCDKEGYLEMCEVLKKGG